MTLISITAEAKSIQAKGHKRELSTGGVASPERSGPVKKAKVKVLKDEE